MGTTAIDKEMYSYFVQLTDVEKKSVLQMVKGLLHEEHSDERITIEQYNREIAEDEAEIERGEGISHEDVVRISEGWLHGR